MKINETNLGFLIETPKITALMGGQKAQILNLKPSFPDLNFIRIKQTHSDITIRSADPDLDYQIEGDAHYTEISKTALCISTADCIPVLVYDSGTDHIAAIHAGWRGVANQIVPKTLRVLQRLGSKPENLQIIIGPHIQMQSFEVDQDVQEQILTTIGFSATNAKSLYHQQISEKKFLVDLNQVMKSQLQLCAVSHENIFDLHIDTFVDPRFHSFRRDKQQSGRQLSFISKN